MFNKLCQLYVNKDNNRLLIDEQEYFILKKHFNKKKINKKIIITPIS